MKINCKSILVAAALVSSLVTASFELHAQPGPGGGNRGGNGGRDHRGGSPNGGGNNVHGNGPRNVFVQPQHVAPHVAPRAVPVARPVPVGRVYVNHGPVHPVYNNVYLSNRPPYHSNWYHGDWHNQWSRPWGYHPVGWGWNSGWGIGIGVGSVGIVAASSPWNWGYYNYYNPYWAAPPGGTVNYINYSQPVVVAAPTPPPSSGATTTAYTPAPPTPAESEGLAIFENARTLFKRGEYRAALSQADRALARVPNDSVIHEFRGLCYFALNDYRQAAAAVHAVVAAGPGWDWKTVSNLYPDVNAYTEQLRALETYRNQNTQAAEARFLLAYHYLLAGHNNHAATELQRVVQLQPNDQLAAQLLRGLASPATDIYATAPAPAPGASPGVSAPALAAPGLSVPPTTTPAVATTPVDAATLIGRWKASRPDGTNLELNLTNDSQFSWKFAEQQMSGTYTLANNMLILAAGEQGTLVGQVAMEPGDKLKFKIAGGNPTDPGLTFTR